MTLRVAFLDSVPLSYGGGYESWIEEALRFGNEAGYEAKAITPSRLVGSASAFLGVRGAFAATATDPHPGERRAGWFDARRALRIADVVYVKNEPHELLFALMATAGSHVPLVVGVHSSMERPGDRLRRLREAVYRSGPYRRMLREAAVVHVLHSAQAKCLIADLGVGPDSVAVIPNGVDTGRFMPGPDVTQRDSTFRVLFAGRLDRQKGIDLLCEAVSLMDSRYSDAEVEVTVAGRGPLDGIVRTAAARSARLRPVGRVQDMPSLYRGHHLAVVPSRWEVFALVPAEALASGLPLVLADIPSAHVFDSDAASFFEPDSASSLVEAIMDMYRNWANRDSYSKRQVVARTYAVQYLDARQSFTRLYGLLQTAVNG